MSSEDWEFTTEFTSIVTEVRMFYLWNYKVKTKAIENSIELICVKNLLSAGLGANET